MANSTKSPITLETFIRPLLDFKAMGYILGGSLIYSVGFNMFILPCHLYNGGFLGISQIMIHFLDEVLGMDLSSGNYTGIIYFLLNLPLLFISMKRFGGDFIVKTIVCVICYSLLLSAVPIPDHSYLPENITAAIAGGVLCGIGAGVTLLSKGSGGGEEILGLLLMQKYKNMSVGKVFNIINVFVFATCAYIYDISASVYSIFFAVVTAVVIDRVHLQNITMTMLIITKKDQIEDLIFETVHRGVTKIKGVGAYSGEATNVLLTVVSKDEAIVLRKVLCEADESVFIIEDESISVVGNFQKRL